MKRIISIIKRPFRVHYRLSVIIGGKTTNTFGLDRRILANRARNTPEAEYWTLYKRGPLWLHERPVDHGIRQ